jgi:hypothetical protein
MIDLPRLSTRAKRARSRRGSAKPRSSTPAFWATTEIASAPTAHEGRQLTTAFVKIESQLARRVIIELVEKPPLFPRLAGNIQAPPKTALTRLVTGVRVSFPGTIRFASA